MVACCKRGYLKMKSTVSSLAWLVQVSHLPESVILQFPPKIILPLDCSFVFAGIFSSFFVCLFIVFLMKFWKLMVLGKNSSYLSAFFFSYPLPHNFTHPSAQQGCCARYITCCKETHQPNFGGASNYSTKGRLMPKIIHLSQWVRLCSSGVFFPFPFVFAIA